MKALRWILVAATVVVLAGVLLWVNRVDLALLIFRLKEPAVGPNHPVAWRQGPASAALPPDQRPPNVILILADDLGFNDITVNGGGVAGGAVPTPNIDAIAHEGVMFTNGYAGNATCAPSRAAIMTGRYATRFGFEFTPTGVEFSRLVGTFRSPGSLHPPSFSREDAEFVPPADDQAVPSSEITIAKLLHDHGYHTIHLGKWHLGGKAGSRPEQKGFDESLGFIPGASMYLPADDPGAENSKQSFDPIDKFLWAVLPYSVQYNGSPAFAAKGYMTDYLTDQAIDGIKANRNQPFFIYLAYNAPHTPLQATKADYDALPQIKNHRLRVYAAMIRNLDRNVGRVMQSLKDQGLDKNTLVIFTSDNGGAHYIGLPDINKPYRGFKATFFEGGVHVPFFMRWPARLPAGATYTNPIGHVDIFATAAAAAGAALPHDRVIDGVDLAPFIAGKASGTPHQTLYWRSGRYRMIIADGWKLQTLESPRRTWLYHLADDPTEHHDLSASQPDKVREMTALLASQDHQMVKPLWPSLLHGAISIDHPLGVPDKPSDEYIVWDN